MAAPTIVASIITGGSNNHETTSEEANAIATDFVSEGVVGTITNTSGVAPMTGAFGVNASGTPDTLVNINTGVAYVTATPSSQNSQCIRAKCTVTGTLTISSNSSGSTKYDWIYIKVDATTAANPNTAADDVVTIVASRSSSASTDDGTPPTYGYPIAVVTVANGFSTITNGNIRDLRTNSIVNLGSSSVSSGWIDLGYTPNTVTANGNRSYDLVFNSTDLTGTLSPGMRLKNTRLVTAPTQCTDLEASSSQYYSKSSPAGMTFTDDFVVSAWVKLESYGSYRVMGRRNGTQGWGLEINSSGQIQLAGYNASLANFSRVLSYQAVPLNRWVHIAAQLDMSAFTATSTTSYIMIDGVDVPVEVSRSGTNPTALVQAGDLEVGSVAGAGFFDGKIAQVAIYSAKVTQANILATISQGLSGSETSLISAYSFNGVITDLNTSNANDLTANGSAVATNADSPFSINSFGTATGTTDYAIITKSVFSTNTTLTVQVPEGNTIPTSGGVSAVAYSTQKAPYGMPIDGEKWRLTTLHKTQVTTTSNATFGSFNGGGNALTVPVGSWGVGVSLPMFNSVTTKATFSLSPTSIVGLALGAEDTRFSLSVQSAAASTSFFQGYLRIGQVVAATSTYVLYSLGAITAAGLDADNQLCEIFAEFNLL